MQLIVIVSVLAMANVYALMKASDKHMELSGADIDSIEYEVEIEGAREPASLLETIESNN